MFQAPCYKLVGVRFPYTNLFILMKNKSCLSRSGVMLLLAMFLIVPVSAQSDVTRSSGKFLTSQWGIGLNASTFGLGGEVIKGLGPKFDLRIGYSTMNLKIQRDIEIQGYGVGLTGYLKTGGPHLLFNFNPLPWLHLTLGGALNQTAVLVSAGATQSLAVEDLMVLPGDVGFIDLFVAPVNKVSPYLGIGFGQTLHREKRLSFSVDLGAYYHSAPSAFIMGSGMLSPSVSEQNLYVINSLIRPYRWWPVLNAQLSYRIL